MPISETKIRKASKDRQCTEHSYHTIRRGDYYLYCAGPPWADWNTSRKWQVIACCLRCANQYGFHTSDTRKQMAEMTPLAHQPSSW